MIIISALVIVLVVLFFADIILNVLNLVVILNFLLRYNSF